MIVLTFFFPCKKKKWGIYVLFTSLYNLVATPAMKTTTVQPALVPDEHREKNHPNPNA
jgi:hypothetical protein